MITSFIRWRLFNYCVTFICCAIFNFRETFNLFENNDFNCFATFNQKSSSICLFIYLFYYEFYFLIFYFFFVRHDFNIVLIIFVMRLFRQRFHVRYNRFQNFLTHLSNSSKSFFLLQMIFANRTNSRYSNKINSTTNQIRWLKSNNWTMHSNRFAINETKLLAKTKTKWWNFSNKTSSFDSTTNRTKSRKNSFKKSIKKSKKSKQKRLFVNVALSNFRIIRNFTNIFAIIIQRNRNLLFRIYLFHFLLHFRNRYFFQSIIWNLHCNRKFYRLFHFFYFLNR